MSEIIIQEKVCCKCRNSKPLDQFRDSPKGTQGKFGACRECQDIYNKELYQKKKDQRLAQIKEWTNSHPDETKNYKLKSYYTKIGKKMPRRKKVNPIPEASPLPPELNF